MPTSNPPHGIFDLAASRTLVLTEGLLIGGACLLALLILALLFFSWRNKRRFKPKPVRNPWEELRNQLAPSLDQDPVVRMGILNHVLRRALELRTRKPFTAWTSAEITHELQTSGQFSSDFQARCAQFLKTADRVIYAQAPWDLNQRDRFEQQISVWLERLQLGQPL